MNRARSEALRLVAEQAMEWLHRLSDAAPKEREECLKWLMESPLHVREALAAIAWYEEIGQNLDPNRRVDTWSRPAAAIERAHLGDGC